MGNDHTTKKWEITIASLIKIIIKIFLSLMTTFFKDVGRGVSRVVGVNGGGEEGGGGQSDASKGTFISSVYM